MFAKSTLFCVLGRFYANSLAGFPACSTTLLRTAAKRYPRLSFHSFVGNTSELRPVCGDTESHNIYVSIFAGHENAPDLNNRAQI